MAEWLDRTITVTYGSLLFAAAIFALLSFVWGFAKAALKDALHWK